MHKKQLASLELTRKIRARESYGDHYIVRQRAGARSLFSPICSVDQSCRQLTAP
jgi:hypothetical protein